jgi:hypothetical protein
MTLRAAGPVKRLRRSPAGSCCDPLGPSLRWHHVISGSGSLEQTMDSMKQQVAVSSDGVRLTGELTIPKHAKGVILFVHGIGGGRFALAKETTAQAYRQA